MITRYENDAKLTVKMANSTLTTKSGYRANQQKLKELFDAAAALGIGKRQGVPNNGLCLELALETMPDATRKRLQLSVIAPQAFTGAGLWSTPPGLTPEEQALRRLVIKYEGHRVITVTKANIVLTSKSGYRNDQRKLMDLFDLATKYGIGERQGDVDQRVALRLSLETMHPTIREKLHLPSNAPKIVSEPQAAAKRPRPTARQQDSQDLSQVEAHNEESAPIQGPASKKRRRVVKVDKQRRTVLSAPAHVMAAKDELALDQSTQESKYGADEKPQLAGLPISELHTKTAASQNSVASSQSRLEQFSDRKVVCKESSEELFSEIIVSPAEMSCKEAWTRLIAWKDRQVINNGRYRSLCAQSGKSR